MTFELPSQTHLQVGWVFVILIRGNLKLLLNPFLQLLSISLEKLESVGVFKLLAPQGRELLEAVIWSPPKIKSDAVSTVSLSISYEGIKIALNVVLLQPEA